MDPETFKKIWDEANAGVQSQEPEDELEWELYEIFDKMVRLKGLVETRRIFAKLSKAISKTHMAEAKNFAILQRYDDAPNATKLAKQLAKEGWGTQDTVFQRINDWRRRRKTAIVRGTWYGPPMWNGRANALAHKKGLIKL